MKRSFQFRLRTLLLCVVPYAAIVMGIISIPGSIPRHEPISAIPGYRIDLVVRSIEHAVADGIIQAGEWTLRFYAAAVFSVAWFFAWFGAKPTWRFLRRQWNRLSGTYAPIAADPRDMR